MPPVERQKRAADAEPAGGSAKRAYGSVDRTESLLRRERDRQRERMKALNAEIRGEADASRVAVLDAELGVLRMVLGYKAGDASVGWWFAKVTGRNAAGTFAVRYDDGGEGESSVADTAGTPLPLPPPSPSR